MAALAVKISLHHCKIRIQRPKLHSPHLTKCFPEHFPKEPPYCLDSFLHSSSIGPFSRQVCPWPSQFRWENPPSTQWAYHLSVIFALANEESAGQLWPTFDGAPRGNAHQFVISKSRAAALVVKPRNFARAYGPTGRAKKRGKNPSRSREYL